MGKGLVSEASGGQAAAGPGFHPLPRLWPPGAGSPVGPVRLRWARPHRRQFRAGGPSSNAEPARPCWYQRAPPSSTPPGPERSAFPDLRAAGLQETPRSQSLVPANPRYIYTQKS
ncbi:unnamed protein product, partial [Iphiclides podalirius]